MNPTDKSNNSLSHYPYPCFFCGKSDTILHNCRPSNDYQLPYKFGHAFQDRRDVFIDTGDLPNQGSSNDFSKKCFPSITLCELRNDFVHPDLGVYLPRSKKEQLIRRAIPERLKDGWKGMIESQYPGILKTSDWKSAVPLPYHRAAFELIHGVWDDVKRLDKVVPEGRREDEDKDEEEDDVLVVHGCGAWLGEDDDRDMQEIESLLLGQDPIDELLRVKDLEKRVSIAFEF